MLFALFSQTVRVEGNEKVSEVQRRKSYSRLLSSYKVWMSGILNVDLDENHCMNKDSNKIYFNWFIISFNFHIAI